MKIVATAKQSTFAIVNAEGKTVLEYSLGEAEFECDLVNLGEAIAFTMTKFDAFHQLYEEARRAHQEAN